QMTDSKQFVKNKTTIVMDFGRITVDMDTIVYLFGTPGQDRFDFMWDILSKNMVGFIVMIDGTNLDSYDETEDIIAYFKELSDVPYILVANKRDEPDAASPEEIRVALGLSEEEKILACNATNPYSASQVIREIVEMIV
ncbi:MAG: GTP-binding protein, partial [bacterium]|nr:GTP-binding protein [bacterium]